ncbi:dynamin family protein [Helicobacter felis]|uniref:dynamin family protein n=1 Tax=Helicobacter felis TaxID=214 RepID=UPI000EF71A7A|nr:dynamin family protein [Helicobacter felis]
MIPLELKILNAILGAEFHGEGLDHFNQALQEFKKLGKRISIPNERDVLKCLQALEERISMVAICPELFRKHIIAVGGGFSAGKSHFINSFFSNKQCKLPIHINPKTAMPSYVMDAEQQCILGISQHNVRVDLGEITSNILDQFTHNTDPDDTKKSLRSDFLKSLRSSLRFIVVGVAFENRLYKDICFIDTPGYDPDGNTNRGHDLHIAKEFLSNASTILWLVSADAKSGILTSSDIELLKGLDLKNKKLYIVVNKADVRPKEDLDRVKEHIKGTLEEKGMEYEGISLYSAKRQCEYGFEKCRLEEFLTRIASQRHTTLQKDILKTLKEEVYDKYREKLLLERTNKEESDKILQSIKLQLAKLDDEYKNEREKIQNCVNDLTQIALGQNACDSQLLKDFERAFEALNTSVDVLFGKVSTIEVVKRSSATKSMPNPFRQKQKGSLKS